MAALQTLRNKPALLMGVIGGALLLFIITMVVENHNPFGPSDKAGKAFGQTIKITDLNQEIEDAINFQTVSRTLQNMANGNNELVKLSEQEREQVRQSTWQANVEELAMLEEINKLGLTVTDEELTNYLQNANFQTQSQEVQLMIMVGYIFSGNPTIAGYQQFLKDYDKIIQQYAQSSSDMVEFVQSVKRASVYAENNLKKTLLQNKYMTLLQGSFISNPVSAKALFNDVYTKYDFEIAAVSYDSISDADIKVTDEDYKQLYNQYKDNFFTGAETREVQLIDFQVRPTPNDVSNITACIKAAEDSLRKTNDVNDIKAILSAANSNLDFQNVYLTKDAYKANNMNDIISRVDSLSVGAVASTYNDGKSVYAVKLVGKKTTADSLQMAFIPAQSKAQADSIMNDLNAGKTWADVAKARNAKDTLIWNHFPFYNDITEADSGVYTHPAQLAVNTPGILQSGVGYVVVKVVAQKAMTEKYNIAIVRNELDFSDVTYEEALSKMNNFVGTNKEAAKVEEAAKKAGYMPQTSIMTTSNYSDMSYRFGDKAGEIMRWIFDEAKVGQVSNVFETRDVQGNTHLLAVAVVSECGDDYLSWDSEVVKNQLKPIAIQQKKAAKALEMVKNVKSMADMKNIAGASVDTISAKSLNELPAADPALMGALQKAKQGQFIGAIKGANGVYAINVTAKVEPKVPYTEAIYMNYAANQNMSNVFGYQGQGFGSFLQHLISRKGNVKDLRYKF